MKVIVVGGGGHAGDVVAGFVALQARGDRSFELLGVVADDEPAAERFPGHPMPWLGPLSSIDEHGADGFVLAIGWPRTRRAVAGALPEAFALGAVTLVHPKAEIGTGVTIGAGSVVLGQAHVSATATIGEHSYIGYLAAIGHDCQVGDFVSVMPGAVASGNVTIGVGVLVGSHATIVEGVTVGDDAVVGAGAVVLHDVPAGVTVVGNPARPTAPSGPG